MKKGFGHIVAAAVAALSIFVSCKDEAVVIPRAKLAQIYAEMLVTDQWIITTPNIRTIADTSLVYEPILEKYGYGSADYRKSVDHYMDDPERFARILRETGEILDARMQELEKKKAELELIEQKRKEAEKFRPDLKLDQNFPYLNGKPYVQYYDSLKVELDDLDIYRLVPVETADTLFDGIRIIVQEPDTLAVPGDTLSVEPVADSVRFKMPSLLKDTMSFRNDVKMLKVEGALENRYESK